MNTLIAYASKYGATRQACQELAGKLSGTVTLADLATGETADPGDFDRVLVGGAIYAGGLRPEAKLFLQTHHDVLLRKDLGLFLCGADETADNREKFFADNVPAELLAHARVRGHFGHQFHFDRMNFFERMIVRKIVKVRQSEDRLDLEAIGRFARDVEQQTQEVQAGEQGL